MYERAKSGTIQHGIGLEKNPSAAATTVPGGVVDHPTASAQLHHTVSILELFQSDFDGHSTAYTVTHRSSP